MTHPDTVMVTVDQLAQWFDVIIEVSFTSAFAAVIGGYCFGSLIRDGVHIFILRRCKTWRRFQRAYFRVTP